jgi:hypothetical protein
MLQKERNRKEHLRDKYEKSSIEVIIKAIEEQLKEIEEESRRRIDKDEELIKRYRQ